MQLERQPLFSEDKQRDVTRIFDPPIRATGRRDKFLHHDKHRDAPNIYNSPFKGPSYATALQLKQGRDVVQRLTS
jgi:hypothetical protein